MAGVESNPFRIEIVVGMVTWGSRVRDNPRLREVSPTGNGYSPRRAVVVGEVMFVVVRVGCRSTV